MQYEYECPKCGYTMLCDSHDIDGMRESGSPGVICPTRGCVSLMRRVYSAPTVIYVGGKPSEVKE